MNPGTPTVMNATRQPYVALELAAQQQAEHAAERDAGGENAHRHRAAARREVVGHERRGRRPVGRLADAHRAPGR